MRNDNDNLGIFTIICGIIINLLAVWIYVPILVVNNGVGIGCFVLPLGIFMILIPFSFITGAIGISKDESPKLAILGCIIILAGCVILGIISGRFNMANCD